MPGYRKTGALYGKETSSLRWVSPGRVSARSKFMTVGIRECRFAGGWALFKKLCAGKEKYRPAALAAFYGLGGRGASNRRSELFWL
jgi:hypothetical protein